MHPAYVYLMIAITGEVVATSSLKATDSFSKLWPTLLVVAGYGIAFYFLSLTLKYIGVGVTYALWSGIGIIVLTAVGILLYGEKIDGPAIVGLSLILSGVVVLNLFSSVLAH